MQIAPGQKDTVTFARVGVFILAGLMLAACGCTAADYGYCGYISVYIANDLDAIVTGPVTLNLVASNAQGEVIWSTEAASGAIVLNGDTARPTIIPTAESGTVYVTALDTGSNEPSGETWYFHAQPPDCNGNGIADVLEIQDGTAEDCDQDGVPDECQLGLRVFVRGLVVDPGFLETIHQQAVYVPEVANSIPASLAEDFDVVVLASDSAMSQEDADAVTSFVAGGGGLIIIQDSPPGAYSGPANPISGEEGWRIRSGTVVARAAHSLAATLSTRSTLMGMSTIPTLKRNAEVVINWEEGSPAPIGGGVGGVETTPMAVAYTYQAGKVVWFNDFWASFQHNWEGDPAYGAQLMRNALTLVGGSKDCNTNGRPDTCDIADGTSHDADSNGVPDECGAN